MAVLRASAESAALPPYLASLMVSEDLEAAGCEPGVAFFRTAFESLRPYGGAAWLPVPAACGLAFASRLEGVNVKPQAEPGVVILSRDGPLPGAADWTHEHADAANTRVSRDRLVKAPLGLLWFGGPGHQGILPRHGHGPQPQVQGGRSFIEGVDGMRALDVYTGRLLWETPLTGRLVEWTWTRNYGCNTPAASEHLLTFRSGAAGYYDLCRAGGTGNLGGFRSGCTNNLIVADGVLNAPDYTRTCTCSYQNQTSLALVPMPEAEMWTFQGPGKIDGVIRRAGILLGAPGNRRADDGTLWLEYPPAGGPSPRLSITTDPPHPRWFRHHSSQVSGEGPRWVAASGALGLRKLTISLGGKSGAQRTYRVRLHFMEPAGLGAGRRRFDVALQGRTVLTGLDISREAGGPRRTLVKEFASVQVGRDLTVTLIPDPTYPVPETVLCGVEVIAQGW